MTDWRFPFSMRTWLVLGLIATALALIGLISGGLLLFLQAYLMAYLFWLGISLGCLGTTLLIYLANSSWGQASRWILESGAKTLWLMVVLFLPIAFGLIWLYPWADPAQVSASPLLAHKSPYLNVPFFLFRSALYFVVWIFFTRYLSRMAQQPETYMDSGRQRTFRGLAAIGLIVYFLTATFAAIDWIMSLTPGWYSTIFGLLFIMAQGLSAFAFVLLFLPHLAQK
jgi:hypothetical protein